MYIAMHDGVTYHVHISGEGEPIVLLHGFTGSHTSWSDITHSLQKNYQVIAIDLLGHGLSDIPLEPARYTIEEVQRDLHYILTELNLECVRLVGYSMGGRVALSFAIRYPKHVKQLILESSSPGLEAAIEREQRIQSDEQLARQIEERGIKWFAQYWGNIPLFQTQKQLHTAILEKVNAQRLNNRTLGLANSLRGMGTGRQPSYWEHIKALHMPVTLIVGELDVKYVQIAGSMKERLSHATIFNVKHAGHNVHLEQQDSFLSILKQVL